MPPRIAASHVAPVPANRARDGHDTISRPPVTASTVLHIEDDRLWTEFTAGLLNDCPEVRQSASAANGRDGLTFCRKMRPGIVLLDLGLPDIDGLVVLDQLRGMPHPPQVLLLTGRMDEAVLYRAISGDVAGLVQKDGAYAQHLRPALAALVDGKTYFPAEVTAAIRRLRSAPDAFYKILSPIERRLVLLTGCGCSDAQIARCTEHCPSTIRVHFHNIKAKLQLKSRHELLSWARPRGLLTGCDRARCAAWRHLPKSSFDSKPGV